MAKLTRAEIKRCAHAPLGVAVVITANLIELTLTIAASIAIVFALSWIANPLQ